MRRLLVFAALVAVAIISASAWLVIDARTDPEPLTTAEHTPRDDDQTQQEQPQEDTEPSPEEQFEEQDSDGDEPAGDEADEVEEDEADDEVTEEPTESQEADADQGGEAAEQEEAEEEVAAVVEEAESLTPADVVIAALDVERPLPVAQLEAPANVRKYVVTAGDTLSDVADQFGVTLGELIAANDLTSPDLVDVGHELKLSVIEPAMAPTYTPVEVPPRVTDEGIVFGTIENHERGVIDSAVIAFERSNSDVRLVSACIEGVLRSYVLGVEPSDAPARIYWRADDGPLNTDRWIPSSRSLESPHVAALHADLSGAESLWMRIGGVDYGFAVASMLDTEVQPNLDSCGS